MTYSPASQKVQAYQAAQQTVRKTKQIVMLYDAAIRNVEQAKLHIKSGDIEARYNCLQKTSDILIALHSCLDMQNGGEIAPMLENFYMALDIRVLNINFSDSAEECDFAIRDLKLMRDAWNYVDENQAENSYNQPIAESSTDLGALSA